MKMRGRIEANLVEAFHVTHMEIVDETGMHNVPPDSESHWKLMLVAEEFSEMKKVARHRAVYRALSGPLSSGIHALSIVALSPQECAVDGGGMAVSQPCLGGSKGPP